MALPMSGLAARLRLAMERRVPLIYLYGIAEGKYVPAWPVLIVGDDPAHKMFTVQIEESARVGADVTVRAKFDIKGEIGEIAGNFRVVYGDLFAE